LPGNSFGDRFRITTFGESHGEAVGAVIDGVPAGLPLSEDDLDFELSFRKPGRELVSPRRESDTPRVISGVFMGRTTGAPLTILFYNEDSKPSFYEEVKYKPRPGHADLPYLQRYGYENWDYRGGGRASARETVARVAAGAVAKKLLMLEEATVAGYLASVGTFEVGQPKDFNEILGSRFSPVRTLKSAEIQVKEIIEKVRSEGDSVGGVVEVRVSNPPKSLGEPVFDKLKADLAKAVLSIPGVTGFEYGMGFSAARMKGNDAADEIALVNGELRFIRNKSGGILGGLSTGEEIRVKGAFKPTSSTKKPNKTVDLRDMRQTTISVAGRHDPCIAIRGVAVMESMVALVLADHAARAGYLPVKIDEAQAEKIQKRWEKYKNFGTQ